MIIILFQTSILLIAIIFTSLFLIITKIYSINYSNFFTILQISKTNDFFLTLYKYILFYRF